MNDFILTQKTAFIPYTICRTKEGAEEVMMTVLLSILVPLGGRVIAGG
ncbi:hypothetical protein ACR74V_02395 [Lacticaseibacillus rhamnosus]|jgi:hypothetical protein